MKQFIEVLKENPNHAYDFIGNNYHKFSKEELNDIVKELLWTIYSTTSSEFDSELHDRMLDEVGDNLMESYEYLFEEDEE